MLPVIFSFSFACLQQLNEGWTFQRVIWSALKSDCGMFSVLIHLFFFFKLQNLQLQSLILWWEDQSQKGTWLAWSAYYQVKSKRVWRGWKEKNKYMLEGDMKSSPMEKSKYSLFMHLNLKIRTHIPAWFLQKSNLLPACVLKVRCLHLGAVKSVLFMDI